MKIVDILNENNVRKLFKNFFEDAKAIIEETVNEETIIKARTAKCGIITRIEYTGSSITLRGPDVDDTLKEYAICIPKKELARMKKYEKEFKKIGMVDLPVVYILLFEETVSIGIDETETFKFLKKFFGDMEFDDISLLIRDTQKRLFKL